MNNEEFKARHEAHAEIIYNRLPAFIDSLIDEFEKENLWDPDQSPFDEMVIYSLVSMEMMFYSSRSAENLAQWNTVASGFFEHLKMANESAVSRLKTSEGESE